MGAPLLGLPKCIYYLLCYITMLQGFNLVVIMGSITGNDTTRDE